MKDYIIVGFGLSGICMAHCLERAGKRFIVIDANPKNSATLTSGAFFNPVVLKRFTPVWKGDEQLQLLQGFFTEIAQRLQISFMEPLPTFRKLSSVQEQNDWFFASEKPLLMPFLSASLKNSPCSCLPAPYGLGEVLHTGRLHTKILSQAYRNYLLQKGLLWHHSFDYGALQCTPEGVAYQNLTAKRIIFCEGFGLKQNPFFGQLPLVGCKGELLSFTAEDLQLPGVVKADGFVFSEGGSFKVGATYDFHDKSPEPTAAARHTLQQKLERLIACPYRVLDQWAAIRPTTRDRRPLVGQHPTYKNLYVLNGLGTRGSMLGPFTAKALYDFIEHRIPIDPEMNITRCKEYPLLANTAV